MSTRTRPAGRHRTPAAVLVAGAGLALLGAGLPGSGASATPALGPAEPAADPVPSYLWAVNAAAGTIAKTAQGDLRVTLRGVPSTVTQFADRPIRKAYAVSTRAFVARWEGLFGDDDPNAVLSFATHSRKATRSIVLTLRNPRLDRGRLVFAATRIHRDVDPSPDDETSADPRPIPTPLRFRSPSLFIDNVLDEYDRQVGEVFFMPSQVAPWGNYAADGRELSIGKDMALFVALGNGSQTSFSTFRLPALPQTWPAMASPTGSALPGSWIINRAGMWFYDEVPPTLLPGQVYFTAAERYDPTSEGGVPTTLGGTVPAGVRAFEFPDVTRPGSGSQFISELRLIRADAPLPRRWLEANGQLVEVRRYQALFSLYGTRYGGTGRETFALPRATAPAGYRWIVATDGDFPTTA